MIEPKNLSEVVFMASPSPSDATSGPQEPVERLYASCPLHSPWDDPEADPAAQIRLVMGQPIDVACACPPDQQVGDRSAGNGKNAPEG